MLMESEELSSWSLHSTRRVHLLFNSSFLFPSNKHSCPSQLACWLPFIPVVVYVQQFAFEHVCCVLVWNDYERSALWYLAEFYVPLNHFVLALGCNQSNCLEIDKLVLSISFIGFFLLVVLLTPLGG